MAKKKKPRIDWLNHSLEFFVVIIGILIAFQLNTCASKKSQQELVEIHLQQLKKETEINTRTFQEAITYGDIQLKKLDTLLHCIQPPIQLEKANRIALELLNIGGVYIRKNAYTTLIESGDMRFINDYSVKNNIVNLYEFYTWVEAFDSISNQLYTTDYYPYLKNNFDLHEGRLQAKEIYQTKRFKNIIAAYRRTSGNRLAKYKECMLEMNKFLKLMTP